MEKIKAQVLRREIDEARVVTGQELGREHVHGVCRRDSEKLANRALTREGKKTSRWEEIELGGFQEEQEQLGTAMHV